MRMFRKGQVFLLVTILVVSFMIGISSVLLDVQRSDYIEPAPDAAETLRAWQVTEDSLTNILDVYLSQVTNGVASPSITEPVDNLETYLSGRGITNSISITTAPTPPTIPGTPTDLESVTVSAGFSIYLASASTTISQDLTIEITYTLDGSQAGLLQVYRNINGEVDYLTGVSFVNTGAGSVTQDNSNGSYDHTVVSGETITATTPSNVVISIIVP